jgi:hypothetical protein
MLAPVWCFNAGIDPGTNADSRGVEHVKTILGKICSLIGADSIEQASELIKDRFAQLGASVDFAGCNIPAEKAIEFIASEMDPLRAGNNPRKIAVDDVRAILRSLAAEGF